MSSRTVIVELPGEIYDRLKQHADQARRPLEAEILEVILTAVQHQDELPGELGATLEQLKQLDSRTLVQLARSHLSADELGHLEALNFKQQREGLDSTDRQERDALLFQYERHLLVRAESVALLKERGFDIATLARV